ncbi:MarR family transcriptional regulator, transcriptional regulator for hemolysin [Anaerovirgula multivorans]|uniref:MarR family transcriptional regulator, transcriptional regulator for hemolysin n=1 Tax=Anaerovirgula multivorans TaxID=312168 RepID=A0A239C1J1_9FIRM|nr:MarR family transcriptional regulator [Anaerovirgula multivorans]SNS13511.1 MarR family transcriptional regulator, transcriptional regulator for hemolysin [Anaerovirgula multivorans]
MNKRQRSLGCLLNKTAHLIKWELNNHLKEYGLTSAQWRVLIDLKIQENLGDSLNNTTPALIAERLNVERPAITRTIDLLIKEGWVSRRENPLDRRSQLIVLAEKSKKIMPQLDYISDEVMKKTLEGFNEEETNQLKSFLIRIIDNFS